MGDRATFSDASTPDVVILKFGGTSVATASGRDAMRARIIDTLDRGCAPVVVVSAMGRRPEPYATDSLLDLVAGLPSSPRERAWLASIGEDLSAIRIAHELRSHDIPAVAISGANAGLIAGGGYEDAAVTSVDPTPVRDLVAQGFVPVVCGFQAAGPDGQVATLGRGGSDTTACILGAALAAERVEIYTDVDGVMTADPRSVDSASVIQVIRADELHQMAVMGSKVVHAPAAEVALGSGVPLVIRNTFTSHPGTRVVDAATFTPETVATAVASTTNVVRFVIDLGAECGSREHLASQSAVFGAMADSGVSLDMFTPAGRSLLLTVNSAAAAKGEAVVRDLGLNFRLDHDLAKVTLVGAGMHGIPGVMAQVARALDSVGADIYQIADSHTTISVLVEAVVADAAVMALHTAFALGEPPKL